jgi:hypothetical protein
MIRPRCTSPADLYRSLAILRGQPVPEPTPAPVPPPIQKQESSIQDPVPSIQNPAASTQDPASNNKQPASSIQNPGSSIAERTPPDWTAFHDEVRRLERDTALQLFAAAQERIRSIRLGVATRHSLSDVTRFLDLASRLARRALGKTDELEMGVSSSDVLADFEQAIKQMSAQPPVEQPASPGADAVASGGASK